MWSKKSFEVVHSIHGDPSIVSLSNSLLYCRQHASSSSRFLKAGPRLSASKLSDITPIINCILISKETGSSIISRRYLSWSSVESYGSVDLSGVLNVSLHKSHIGSIHLHRQCRSHHHHSHGLPLLGLYLGAPPSMKDRSSATT